MSDLTLYVTCKYGYTYMFMYASILSVALDSLSLCLSLALAHIYIYNSYKFVCLHIYNTMSRNVPMSGKAHLHVPGRLSDPLQILLWPT